MATGPWWFPIRKASWYSLRRPDDSYGRPGYQSCGGQRTHQAIDISVPIGADCLMVLDGEMVWRGTYGDLGLVLEVAIPIEVDGKARTGFLRYCHLAGAVGFPRGKNIGAKYHVAEVGRSGRTSGPHLHLELGLKPIRSARCPKVNLTRAVQQAYDLRRFAA